MTIDFEKEAKKIVDETYSYTDPEARLEYIAMMVEFARSIAERVEIEAYERLRKFNLLGHDALEFPRLYGDTKDTKEEK